MIRLQVKCTRILVIRALCLMGWQERLRLLPDDHASPGLSVFDSGFFTFQLPQVLKPDFFEAHRFTVEPQAHRWEWVCGHETHDAGSDTGYHDETADYTPLGIPSTHKRERPFSGSQHTGTSDVSGPHRYHQEGGRSRRSHRDMDRRRGRYNQGIVHQQHAQLALCGQSQPINQPHQQTQLVYPGYGNAQVSNFVGFEQQNQLMQTTWRPLPTTGPTPIIPQIGATMMVGGYPCQVNPIMGGFAPPPQLPPGHTQTVRLSQPQTSGDNITGIAQEVIRMINDQSGFRGPYPGQH